LKVEKKKPLMMLWKIQRKRFCC